MGRPGASIAAVNPGARMTGVSVSAPRGITISYLESRIPRSTSRWSAPGRVAHALALLGVAVSLLFAQSTIGPPSNLRFLNVSPEDYAFYPGDFSGGGVLGNSLPGTWRPFSADSPWNTPIPATASVHPDSATIIAGMAAQAGHIYLARSYSIPVWVVNSTNVPLVRVRSDSIFDFWDVDLNGWTDIGVPVTPEMWAEATPDAHICIVDPFRQLAFEMSKFGRLADGTPTCTTFNVWEIAGRGVGDPNQGRRWQVRGGRGSGFPEIAGLLRPEEISAGEIRHALAFSYSQNRRADDGSDIFLSPACRSDGKAVGPAYPIEGMRFQLDPSLTDQDFDSWGLSREAKIVARALQRYGMFLGDNGGAMAVFPQLLAASGADNYTAWERRFPGLFAGVSRIPTNRFRVINTGTPITKK